MAKKLHDAQVVAPANPTSVVPLTAIKQLTNINTLANGARPPVARSGITGIYGEIGLGKSGYSRAFKKACRARDRREPILPNANPKLGKSGPAQATLEADINDYATDLLWKRRCRAA